MADDIFRLGGDKAKITEKLRQATVNYDNELRSFNTEKGITNVSRQRSLAFRLYTDIRSQFLKGSLRTRKERWLIFQKKISARARAAFIHVLSERSYKGSLCIDHKGRKLEIKVLTDPSDSNGAVD